MRVSKVKHESSRKPRRAFIIDADLASPEGDRALKRIHMKKKESLRLREQQTQAIKRGPVKDSEKDH